VHYHIQGVFHQNCEYRYQIIYQINSAVQYFL
jgi:hypothetical protein